jgi:mannose-6-phosphate isomerase-like protein (cupin superfamily)
MTKISLDDCKEFVAGDNTFLREILHPEKGGYELSYSLAWFRVPPGKKTFRHSLSGSEVYYIISGKGKMSIDERKFEVKENDTVYIKPNSVQFIENLSETEPIIALCIVEPAWKKESETIY